MAEPGPCWVDGRWVGRDDPALAPTDSAYGSGRGCYTTARYRDGRVRFADRHAARIVRDARRLGIGEVDPADVARALEAVGRAAFADAEGVVRIQASRSGSGRVHLCAVPRHAGPEPDRWRAIRSPLVHEGRMPWSGAKVSNHLLFALAAEGAREAEVDEALLLDREGCLVEGSRANLIVVLQDGALATPDPARGGVLGVGLEVLRERGVEVAERDVPGEALDGAREIIAVNAIRGPRPIVELDGRAVADGAPGPVAARLAAVFDED